MLLYPDLPYTTYSVLVNRVPPFRKQFPALVFGGALPYNHRTMKPPGSDPSAVAAVLSRVLKRVDPEQELRTYAIWTFWNAEVGDTIARRAQPTRVRNGILFVTVATHSWMQELRFLKEQLRARLNARLGAELVRDIMFIAGSIDEALVPAAKSPEALFMPAATPEVDLPPIADPELAGAFRRVVQARAKRISRTVKHDT